MLSQQVVTGRTLPVLFSVGAGSTLNAPLNCLGACPQTLPDPNELLGQLRSAEAAISMGWWVEGSWSPPPACFPPSHGEALIILLASIEKGGVTDLP